MMRLSRKEILEGLVRQGIHGLTRMKSECRRFEPYWELRLAGVIL